MKLHERIQIALAGAAILCFWGGVIGLLALVGELICCRS